MERQVLGAQVMGPTTYKCEACGLEITTPRPLTKIRAHQGCPKKPKGTKVFFYRVWKKTPVIFKATGYSKNNLTR